MSQIADLSRSTIPMRQTEHDAFLRQIKPMVTEEKRQATNIIMILMDDLGWGDLSCFGSQAIRTPNLDRLADEGIVMENGYSSSPICTPSRFGLLTGRYPCRGLIDNVFFPTIPVEDHQIIAQRYEIADDEIDGRASPQLIERTRALYQRISHDSLVNGILEDELTIAELLSARGYRTGMFGKWHLGDHSPHLPNDKGFDYFYGAHYSNDMCPYHFWRNREIAVEAPFDQRQITGLLNQELFSFIRQSGPEPFFAYYASPWPHHPISSGQAFVGTSKAGVYGDCIEEFDHGIGELLDLLEYEGKLDQTLIVFTSDNGPWHQGSPGLHRGRKGNVFDGGQIVPTLIRWPAGGQSGITITEPVMNIDFFPTFSDLAGIPLPDDRIIDGCSLLPLLRGDETRSPHDVLFFVDSTVPIRETQGYAIRSRDHFKYFAAKKSENSVYQSMMIHPFLFDLQADPNESYDVRSIHPAKASELKDQLEAFNASVRQNPRGWI